jgi:hypothetical protein
MPGNPDTVFPPRHTVDHGFFLCEGFSGTTTLNVFRARRAQAGFIFSDHKPNGSFRGFHRPSRNLSKTSQYAYFD